MTTYPPILATAAALEAAKQFTVKHGSDIQPEGLHILINVSFTQFVETFHKARFFQEHLRHHFPALSAGDPSLDYDNTFHLHFERRADGSIFIGLPHELPLAPGYHEQRVMEEAAMVEKEAEG